MLMVWGQWRAQNSGVKICAGDELGAPASSPPHACDAKGPAQPSQATRLHIARQHDDVDALCLQQRLQLCFLRCLACPPRRPCVDGQVAEGDAKTPRHALQGCG